MTSTSCWKIISLTSMSVGRNSTHTYGHGYQVVHHAFISIALFRLRSATSRQSKIVSPDINMRCLSFAD